MNSLEMYRSLPSDYRNHIQTNSNLITEVVDGCPRSCWYCDEPNKNGIHGYLDEKIIDYLTDEWKPGKFIFFYHNAEPAMWRSGDKTYKNLVQDTIQKGHRVYTSTSLPAEAIDDLVSLEQWIVEHSAYDRHVLRVSHNPNNSAEVYAFREKLKRAVE